MQNHTDVEGMKKKVRCLTGSLIQINSNVYKTNSLTRAYTFFAKHEYYNICVYITKRVIIIHDSSIDDNQIRSTLNHVHLVGSVLETSHNDDCVRNTNHCNNEWKKLCI